jgi:hypothetical protein
VNLGSQKIWNKSGGKAKQKMQKKSSKSASSFILFQSLSPSPVVPNCSVALTTSVVNMPGDEEKKDTATNPQIARLVRVIAPCVALTVCSGSMMFSAR